MWGAVSALVPAASASKLRVASVKAAGQQSIQCGGRVKDSSFSYRAREGDLLSEIAQRFNVSVKALRQWNRNQIGKRLKPGQRLRSTWVSGYPRRNQVRGRVKPSISLGFLLIRCLTLT
ncbi:MAG TPA: LysM peptidoglycan-binding domain-containing protein [Methylothermaceae bacterium]|nr:LysM peptidoglycan-binding domain-containing protein [Methylothermaceae bacterium]